MNAGNALDSPTSDSVGILGYGRFGRALTEMVGDAGLSVRVFDPDARVPAGIRAGSFSDLAKGSGRLVLAVPTRALRACVRGLRAHLTPDHLVMDVASVKLEPEVVMAELLGPDVPWIATHPLFGPSAIARGERPLRAVVCPNGFHPGAAAAARRLYERIGCEVMEQDADTHDRLFARGHALTFFVAKGLLAVDEGSLTRAGPPSVSAMSKVVDSVRSDAGHLFLSIERDNPYAADARRALLEELAGIHAQIESVARDGAEDDPGLGIPDLGDRAPELQELRTVIDELDLELIALLRRRARLARGAGRIKSEHGRGVRDPLRERALLADRRLWAQRVGLDPKAVDAVFRSVMRLSRAAQNDTSAVSRPEETS